MKTLLVALFLASLTIVPVAARSGEDSWDQVLPAGMLPDDARLAPPRTLNDANHPWEPPATLEAWQATAAAIRARVLVAAGLWPLPPRSPLEPVVHGRIERDDYVIEKVIFESLPGHHVTGNLYRPREVHGRVPGVLCPHGHWASGRFHDAGEDGARQSLERGGESDPTAARHPLQARMVHLARMGCVVFHYDMVGYASSRGPRHGQGFHDVAALLHLESFFGLQTWNSIRALDFLASLPEVDPERIGVTGASGGGTQTFVLGAVDPRPAVAFPAVMVSMAMQGGCVCENAPYLRVGINNVAITALFAPKPLALSGADDWTREIETRGLPQLRAVYGLYERPENVLARAFPQYPHNYNRVARELMYGWFDRHLGLGHDGDFRESTFTAVPLTKLDVWSSAHPVPKDSGDPEVVRTWWTRTSAEQYRDLLPQAPADLEEYLDVVGTAARVLLDDAMPHWQDVTWELVARHHERGLECVQALVGRRVGGERIPLVGLVPEGFLGRTVLWIDGRGKAALFEAGRPGTAVRRLLDAGFAVFSADPLRTGESLREGEAARPALDELYAGYTLCYNRPLIAERVRDVLTALAALRHEVRPRETTLVGTGTAGPWTALAGALARGRVDRILADLGGFGFAKVIEASDPDLLPGALKYGGLGGLAALAAPTPVVFAGTGECPPEELEPLRRVYSAMNASLTLEAEEFDVESIVDRLLDHSTAH